MHRSEAWKWWIGTAVAFVIGGPTLIAAVVVMSEPNQALLWIGYLFCGVALACIVTGVWVSGWPLSLARRVSKSARSLMLGRKIGRDGVAIAWWLRQHGRTILREELREVYRGYLTDNAFDQAFEALLARGVIKVSNTGAGALVRPSGPSSSDLMISPRHETRIRSRFRTPSAADQNTQLGKPHALARLQDLIDEVESRSYGDATYEDVTKVDREAASVLPEEYLDEYGKLGRLEYCDQNGRDEHGRRRRSRLEAAAYYADALRSRHRVLGSIYRRMLRDSMSLSEAESLSAGAVEKLILVGRQVQRELEGQGPTEKWDPLTV